MLEPNVKRVFRPDEPGLPGRCLNRTADLLKPTKKKLIITAASLLGPTVLLFVTVHILSLFFILTTVEGVSMTPTVMEWDVIMNRTYGPDPKYQDIVVVDWKPYPEALIMKRIGGVPGQVVTEEGTGRQITLGPDEYWLTADANQWMGHRRTIDSNDFGPVKREDIKGIKVGGTSLLRRILSWND